MKQFLFGALVLLSTSLTANNDPKLDKKESLFNFISQQYNTIEHDGELPSYEVFSKGLVGYLNLKGRNKLSDAGLLTLIDFTKSSSEKRMWVIDLNTNKVIYHDLVAHGKNTGNVYAKNFSNVRHSNSSSLGFYVTGETYMGRNGFSMRLDGQEVGFNDNARQRAVVMHSAKYVSDSFAKKYGRIGRSFGCPAIKVDGHKDIIKKLAQKTCLFIYYPDVNYTSKTKYHDTELAYAALSGSNYRL